MMKLLENLINLKGISGDEKVVRSFIYKEAKKYCKDVFIDKMGNVVARKKGVSPSVLLMAHMDEIGLMVSSIESDGKIHLSSIGGIDPVILVGHRVEIETSKGHINGIITTKEILNDSTGEKKINMESLFVFTGLNKKALGNLGIKVGSYISFSRSSDFCTLGHKDMVAGKALDDRVGCYILLEVMRKLKTKHEVIFVFTVQEEVGLYGSKTSFYNLTSDYALAVDVTAHDDDGDRMLLGNGPYLTIKDAEMIGNKCLNESIERLAKKKKIKLQLEVSEVGTTDASSVFAAKGGIPSAVIGVAVANIHTPIGAAHKGDIEDAVSLISEFLKSPPDRCW
jgi:endoglucanase